MTSDDIDDFVTRLDALVRAIIEDDQFGMPNLLKVRTDEFKKSLFELLKDKENE